MIRKLKALWYSVRCRILRDTEIDYRHKKRFGAFGEDSVIMWPVKLHSGLENIFVGAGTTILSHSRLQTYNFSGEESGRILIGDGCYIGFNFTVLSADGKEVKIGNQVLIASDVLISNENHGIDPESDIPYMDQPLTAKSVEIGNGCWLGEKVCILPGVTVGEKSIIGAGSVVTRDVPPYSIAAGNPARIIKQYNFSTHCWEKV